MSLREWLIAIGTLVIIGIVIDGVRRMPVSYTHLRLPTKRIV